MSFDQKPWKTGLRGCVGYAALLLGSLFMLNCFHDPMSPVLPSWDLNLTFPFVNRLYTLSEMVEKDTTLLRVGAGNQLMYSTSAVAPPTYLGNLISLLPDPATSSVVLGPFNVTLSPVVTPLSIPGLAPGTDVVIPATTWNLPDIPNVVSTAGSATFERGRISLTLKNNLPVDIEVLNTIQLLDNQGAVVSTFNFGSPGRIPSGQSLTADDDLANKRLGGGYRVSGLNFRTPVGSGLVRLAAAPIIVATLTPSGLVARSANLESLPAQRLMDNDVTNMAFQDSTKLQEVRVRSGQLNFSFTSEIAIPMRFRFRFNEFYRPAGTGFVVFEDSLDLPAAGSANYALNLAGWMIRSQSGTLMSSSTLVSSIIIVNPVNQMVSVHATDRVVVSFVPASPIVADSAIGVLKPTWVDMNTSMPVNFGDFAKKFSGQLNIPSAALDMYVQSTIAFPMDLNFRISAKKNAAGDYAFLDVPSSQRRLRSGSGTIQFDPASVGQFLSQMSGKLPDSLRITGKILVNPPDVYDPTPAGAHAVGHNCSFGGTMNVDLPLTLGITNGSYSDTVSVGDTTADGRKDYIPDKKRLDEVNYGKMYIEVVNGTPIELAVNLKLLDKAKQTVLSLPQSGQPIGITAAQVDVAGSVTIASKSTSIIELTGPEVQKFDPAEYLTYSIALITTPGSPFVRFTTTDNVKIRVWSNLSYRVNR